MTGIIVLVVYCTLFIGSLLVVTWATRNFFSREDYTSLKTVTFGDESAVRANRIALSLIHI